MDAFIRRAYFGSEPTNRSLWGIAGGPGDSTQAFIPFADFFVSSDPSLTMYLQDIRGTGNSSYFDCANPPVGAFNPYNASQVESYDTCHRDIANKYPGKNQFYSAYHGAMDLKSSIELVNPETVSIFAVSVGTYYANTLMLMLGDRIDSVILDGPVPPGI